MRRDRSQLAFIDVLFCLLILLLMLINPPTRSGVLEAQTAYTLYLFWPTEPTRLDLDLYVLDPQGRVVNFIKRQAKSTELHRDDLGRGEGEESFEVVGFRHPTPGYYHISVHTYSGSPRGREMRLLLVDQNGNTICQATHPVPGRRDEQAVFDLLVSPQGPECTPGTVRVYHHSQERK